MDALMVKHKTSHREKRMLSFLTKVGIFFSFSSGAIASTAVADPTC